MVGVAQVADFVGDHVVDANRWGPDQVGIEGDDAILPGAAPAPCHHPKGNFGLGEFSGTTPLFPSGNPFL